jgi:hypothetical protein
MYYPHPSEALNSAFAARPFQGATPEDALFMFVGLDANYGETIERSPIFPQLLEYLDDGVAFWMRYGVHHPFLLPGYSGDGRKYHKTFARIGFSPANAAEVSFVELLHLPTYGRSMLQVVDLNGDHLQRVNAAIEHGTARHIFIPDRVGKLMRSSGAFPWMPKTPADAGEDLKVWHRIGEKTIYWHYHFSVYGIFEERKTKQLQAIRRLVNTST